MKYQVQISYTNPAHEHVSLRRRVDTVTRIVEARTEQEALNRAANQQRALGFMIKEAKVVKPAVLSEKVEQIDEITRNRALETQHQADRKVWQLNAMIDASAEGSPEYNRLNDLAARKQNQVARLFTKIDKRDRRLAALQAGRNRRQKVPVWSQPQPPETSLDRLKSRARRIFGPKTPPGLESIREEVEQIDEATHFLYTGTVNDSEYELTIPRDKDISDYSDKQLHRILSDENPHLKPHEVTAIVNSGGEDESKVNVEHKGKKYTHHVINHQEPRRIYNEEVEQVGEATGEHPAIQKFAAIQHDNWRKGFDPEGTGKERIKKNSDGTEGNINVPFHKLHPDWQKENLAAGRAAHAAIQKHPNDIEKASEHVHNEWMKRNPKADYNAHQHVPYNDLPEDEKEKDREHVRTMHKLVNVNEGFDKGKPQPKLPAGEKYTPNKNEKQRMLKPFTTPKTVKKVNPYYEEVEQVDELNYEYNMKRLPPKGFTVPHQQNPHLHYNPKTKQVHNTRTRTTYPDYGNEFVGYRMQNNEEVEQVDEVKLNTAVRTLGQMKQRADDYYSSPEDKKRVNRFRNKIARKFGEKGAAVADKASSNVGNVERHSNPGDALGRRDQPKITPDSVMQRGDRQGKLRPGVLKDIKRLQKAKLYSLTSKTKPNLPEEVEQMDEANMRFDPEAAARPTSRDVKNFQMRDKNPRAAAASKKYIRRMTKLGGLGPNQTKKDTEAHMKAHFGEETGADKRDAGYKMSPAVRAAQKKSDELSKEKPKHQAGTLAAKNVREEKANVNNSKDKLKLLKDRVKNKVKTANMMPSLDITGK